MKETGKMCVHHVEEKYLVNVRVRSISIKSEFIKMYIESDFDLSNPVYPVGICSNCRRNISIVSKNPSKASASAIHKL